MNSNRNTPQIRKESEYDDTTSHSGYSDNDVLPTGAHFRTADFNRAMPDTRSGDSGLRSNKPSTPIADKYASAPEKIQKNPFDTAGEDSQFEFQPGSGTWARRNNTADVMQYGTHQQRHSNESSSREYGYLQDEQEDPDEYADGREPIEYLKQGETVGNIELEEGTEKSKIGSNKRRPSSHSKRASNVFESMSRILDIPLNTLRRGGNESAGPNPTSAHDDPVLMPVSLKNETDDEEDDSDTRKASILEKEDKDRHKRAAMLVAAVIIILSVLLLTSIIMNAYLFSRHNMVPQASPMIYYNTNTSTEPPISLADEEVQSLMGNHDLRKVFYGVNYSPQDSQYPACGVNQRQVTLDVAVMSQITNRIRLYGTDCNQVGYVLNAIQSLGVDMTVTIGLWVGASLDVTLRQLSHLRSILRNYPHRLIDAILIGNEALFRNELTTSDLIAYIEYVKDYLHSQGFYDIKVGTSDIGSKWTSELIDHVDVLAANIHPFFGGVNVRESTKWTYDFFFNQVAVEVPAMQNVTYMISEVGWPSGGGSLHGAKAGLDELQIFLDNWICQNEDSSVGWYWFEAFDQPWKSMYDTETEQWESQWGLFTSDRQLKNITLPTCSYYEVVEIEAEE